MSAAAEKLKPNKCLLSPQETLLARADEYRKMAKENDTVTGTWLLIIAKELEWAFEQVKDCVDPTTSPRVNSS